MTQRMQRAISAVTLAGAAALVPVTARSADLGVQLHAGTLGLGAGIAVELDDRWNTRLGFNQYSMERDFTESDIDYTADIELDNVYLLADWHPFGGGFRVTGGIYYNNNELRGTAAIESGDEVGGETVPAGQGGTLAASVTFQETAPYLGVGWGSAIGGSLPVALSLDIGVLAQGSPIVELTNRDIGGISDEDVEREEAQLEDEVSGFTIYPVLSVGMLIRF